MDTSCATPCMEQSCAWTFYAIHTSEHMCTVIMHGGYCYFMCVYLVKSQPIMLNFLLIVLWSTAEKCSYYAHYYAHNYCNYATVYIILLFLVTS